MSDGKHTATRRHSPPLHSPPTTGPPPPNLPRHGPLPPRHAARRHGAHRGRNSAQIAIIAIPLALIAAFTITAIGDHPAAHSVADQSLVDSHPSAPATTGTGPGLYSAPPTESASGPSTGADGAGASSGEAVAPAQPGSAVGLAGAGQPSSQTNIGSLQLFAADPRNQPVTRGSAPAAPLPGLGGRPVPPAVGGTVSARPSAPVVHPAPPPPTHSPPPTTAPSIKPPVVTPTVTPPTKAPVPSSGPANLAGWPNAGNTGVPSGVTLKASGGLVITQAGAVVTGLDVNGCVDIKAANVVITNTRISCKRGGVAIRLYPGASLRMSNSEINGLGSTDSGIGYDNYTLIAVNIHDCIDGLTLGSNDVIESSYVHDLARGTGTHNDAIQTVGGSNSVVRDSTLEAYRASTADFMNSAIQTGHLIEPLTNILIQHNFMDGGNYTVNAGSTSTNGYAISAYIFKSNVFGSNSRYGPVQAVGSGTTFDSTNVWAATGRPVL
ncbi:MAG: hypothetical protein QOH29_557 [Actinomycetota bacterium]|nr:hypothetical protein [Actinomycetota bacterium]